MQRNRLSTVLANLGLAGGLAGGLGACTHTGEPASPPLPEDEPSGLGSAPKPELARTTRPAEPHFEGVPLQFCQATFEQRNATLVKTQSYLQIWNELAPQIRNPLAHNIPATEIDARVLLCGSEHCSNDAARLAEATADYMVGTGLLIPSGDAMLVVPELAAPHVAGRCINQTTIEVARQDSLVHVRAITLERRYSYVYYHGYSYSYDYGRGLAPTPLDCRTDSVLQRDLIIDVTRGELELVIDQHIAEEGAPARVELAFTPDGIVLSGCATSLPLAWTE